MKSDFDRRSKSLGIEDAYSQHSSSNLSFSSKQALSSAQIHKTVQ